MSKRSQLERIAKDMLEAARRAGAIMTRRKPLIRAIKDALDERLR